MIDIQNLSFGYSRNRLLFHNLNLALPPGRIYGLLGKNGAGKSSLLRNVAGLLFPTSGHIRVAGHEPKKRQPSFLQDIYFLPEEIYLPVMSFAQYVSTMGSFYPHFNEQQFYYYLKEFDVPATGKITALSYGQRKKVLISFALATNTKVLLMDEPTNGLDIPSKSQFRKLVATALTDDRVLLISTHQVRDLDNLIDSVIILEESEVLLNHALDTVSERLRFQTLANVNTNEEVLYAEPSLRGYSVVMENSTQADSKIDLERLFNAVVNNPTRIKELFTPNS